MNAPRPVKPPFGRSPHRDDSNGGAVRDDLRILRLNNGVVTLPIDSPLSAMLDEETGILTLEAAIMGEDTNAFIARLKLGSGVTGLLVQMIRVLDEHEMPLLSGAPIRHILQ